jgi:CheY-like chemotaxis protein
MRVFHVLCGENGVVSQRVLIADDMCFVRDVVRVTLELADFEVVGEAEDGLTAFALAFELEPDFVILDYRMPKMDGVLAADLIRATRPEITIVAFSTELDRTPWWADAQIPKVGVTRIVPMLQEIWARREMCEQSPFEQLTLI